MKLRAPLARLDRLESRAAAVSTVSIHVQCDRWTDRFEQSSSENAALVRRVLDRRLVKDFLWFGDRNKPRACAAYMCFGLLYQVPHVWADPRLPSPPPEVPDPEVVVALYVEFMTALVQYQVVHHDLYPRAGFGLREIALKELARRRAEREAQRVVTDEKTPATAGVKNVEVNGAVLSQPSPRRKRPGRAS